MSLVRFFDTLLLVLALIVGSNSAFAKQMDSATCAAEQNQIFEAPQSILEVASHMGKSGDVDNDPACRSLQKICRTSCNGFSIDRPKYLCGLTDAEFAILRYYTASGYGCINQILRAKTVQSTEPAIRALNGALGKLPSFVGFVSRGARLPQEVIDQHRVGSVIEYPSFTSTSTVSGFGGNVQYAIFSKTGKPIMGFSGIPDEKEVLFRAPTRFKVLSKEQRGHYDFIVMKEISPSQTAVDDAKEDLDLLRRYQNFGSHNAVEEWLCQSTKAVKNARIEKVVYGDQDITAPVKADFEKNGKILNCVNHYGPERIVNIDMTVTQEMEVTYQCTSIKDKQKPKTVRLFCNPYDAYFTPKCD